MAEEDNQIKLLLDRHYPSIKFFITRVVNFQDYDEGRVPSQELFQKTVDHFAEQPDSNGEIDKYLVVDAVYRLRKEGIVRATKSKDNRKVIYLSGAGSRPGTAAREMSMSQDIRFSQERPMREISLEGLGNKEVDADAPSREEEATNTPSQQLQDDPRAESELEADREHSEDYIVVPNRSPAVTEKTDTTRHAEGYAEMTRDAIPLNPPPEIHSSPIRTPSRKRKRPFEIAASVSSSCFGISPRRHSNSTPRGSHKRPWSGDPNIRRRSDPSNMFSPKEHRSPLKPLKEERKDTSPLWLVNAVHSLHVKYPNAYIITDNGSVRCKDCNRDFQPGGNNSLSGVDTHLRSKAHKTNSTTRTQKLGPPPSLPSATSNLCFTTTMDTGSGFGTPQQPLTVFAQRNQPTSAAAIGQQYFQALEAEKQQDTFRTMLLENKYAVLEKERKEDREHLETSLKSSESVSVSQIDRLSGIVQYAKEEYQKQLRVLGARVDLFEGNGTQKLDEVSEVGKRLEQTIETRLDDMTGRLARSDHRNINQIEEVTGELKNFKKDTEEQLRLLFQKLSDFEKAKNTLASMSQKQEESQRMHQESVTASIKGVEETNQTRRDEMTQKMREMEASHLKLKEENRLQQEMIYDLESAIQLQTEEQQRQRESDIAFRNSITQQLEAHIALTDKKVKQLEKKNTAKVEAVERQSEERIRDLEGRLKESFKNLDRKYSKQIGALKKDTAFHSEAVERLNHAFPSFAKALTELRKNVAELEPDLEETDSSRAPGPLPQEKA